MVEVVFVKDTVKRRAGDRVAFDEVSAAKIVARGDAEYAAEAAEPVVKAAPLLAGAWGAKSYGITAGE